jgi:hypothetical protein
MSDLICPFGATLVKRDFACQYATEIIRRGGAEIACVAEAAHADCCAIHNTIKAEALNAMGLEDDLLSLPHSVLVKIQFGSLLALQAEIGAGEGEIKDIYSLTTAVNKKFADHSQLPFDAINTSIINYKISRRSKK